jgi:TusA-related sulfurtransferase
MEMLTTGRTFVRALAARNFGAVQATLADDVRFRMLLPRGPEEVRGAGAAAQTLAGWFGGADALELEASAVDRVVDRLCVSYRLRVRREDGWRRIEQRLFAAVGDGGRMETIDLLCSGFRPLPEPAAGVRRFDAGDLGCADGLAEAFRRQVQAIAPGEVLVVVARDPAAKEDLPALARLMGHAVRSVEASADGRLVITVERGR